MSLGNIGRLKTACDDLVGTVDGETRAPLLSPHIGAGKQTGDTCISVCLSNRVPYNDNTQLQFDWKKRTNVKFQNMRLRFCSFCSKKSTKSTYKI